MTLGDRELTDADKSVHLAGSLVTEQSGCFVISKRQVAVGTLLVEIRLILERTGHRTESVHLAVAVGIAENEHAVLIVIPVSADFIEVALCHERSLCEQPAALLLLVLDKALQKLDHSRALGKQNGKSLTDIVNRCEEAHLSAELVVVALACLGKLSKVLLEH